MCHAPPNEKEVGLQQLDRCMSQRASWDWKEVCDRSIPQLEQGSKRHSASEVGSPMEGQAHRRSGAARILGIGKSGGLTLPHPTQGSLEKGGGLVLGKTKSHGEATVTRVVVAAGRRTPPA